MQMRFGGLKGGVLCVFCTVNDRQRPRTLALHWKQLSRVVASDLGNRDVFFFGYTGEKGVA